MFISVPKLTILSYRMTSFPFNDAVNFVALVAKLMTSLFHLLISLNSNLVLLENVDNLVFYMSYI